MHLKIHTQGIRGSGTIKEGEDAGALFNSVLELDGQIYDRATAIDVKFEGDSFATVTVTFIPGDIEVVTHTSESWKKICEEADKREKNAKIRRSDGRVIAVYVSPKPEED